MNIVEELRSLDPQDPGRWPFPIRIGVVGVWFVLLTAVLIYFVVWSSKQPDLERAQGEESTLRGEFTNKHAKAVNLDIYKGQLKDIERSFGALLRQLPGKTEVPNLLVDISQTGVAAGLQEKTFQPAAEQKKDFYAEQPFKLRLIGSYHQFGEFVSGIAALPRIVTLHDIEIRAVNPSGKDFDNLTLELTAKTYRYLDEEELAAADAQKGTVARRPQG
ncbi:MAG: type 4a pilus biogenesis protein PilO [Gammaproteobacteria bacterium]